MRAACVIVIAAAFLAAAPRASAQPRSPALVKSLVDQMSAQHLDAFAARDPNAPDRIVAAMLFPGVQLLVVSARYPSPAALDPSFANKDYRDVYKALQGSAIPDSKLFVQDMGADGLRTTEAQSADVVYQQVVHQTILNGKVDDGKYQKTLSPLDADYSRALEILIAGLGSAQPVAQSAAR